VQRIGMVRISLQGFVCVRKDPFEILCNNVGERSEVREVCLRWLASIFHATLGAAILLVLLKLIR